MAATAAELCAKGRVAISQRAWGDAYDALRAADDLDPLGANDAELLGLAALLTGHDSESDALRERAHSAYLAAGDVEAAARVGFWLALALTLRGEPARGGGWFARVQRLLDDAGLHDSVWRGFLLVSNGMQTLFSGDAAGALRRFEAATAIADRHHNADLRVLAGHGHGQSLIASGDVASGFALLDEVMVLATTDDVSPQVVGLVYCAIIELCVRNLDVRRGQEWTTVLSRWCAAQPQLVPYRGQCLVHRAEILQLHGSWGDALAEAESACRLLAEPLQSAVGKALYQRGELQRLRGHFDAAEISYREASLAGHDPQPGLALLRLAEGHVDVALAALRRAVAEAPAPLRTQLLPSLVEVALAAGDVGAARLTADELTTAAGLRDVTMLQAVAMQADGATLLGEEKPGAALQVLRKAWSFWQDIDAPYDAARTRVLVGMACRALGDDDTAEMELDAARWAFDRLGAAPDVERVARLSARRASDPTPAGLTLREVQVLRLVATGATNRAISRELFVSEKTIARHVANIFNKLGISSRAAATAFAYEHHLE
jgi:DNA-binding CsgD family transcriptional regulator